MKKDCKKILSIMLASAMLVTSIPAGTFAEDDVSNVIADGDNDDNDKEMIVIVWETQDKYEWSGSGQQIPTASAKNSEGEAISLIPNLTGPLTDGKAVECGEYTVTVNLCTDDDKKYALSNPSQTFKIEPREVAVEWSGETTREYTGAGQELPTAYYENINKVKIKCDVSEKDNKAFRNVDTYRFIASTPDGNYKLKEDTAAREFSIAVNLVELEWKDENGEVISGDEVTYEYDGDAHQITAAEIKIGEEETLGVSVSFLDEDGNETTEPTDAGTYRLVVRIENDNCALAEGTVLPKMIIEPFPVEIKWYREEDFEEEWNDEDHYIYNGAEQVPVAAYMGAKDTRIVVPREDVLVKTQEGIATDAVNVGTYTVEASVTDKNYNVIGETSRTFEIKQLSITIAPRPDQGKVYGEIDSLPYEYEISYIEDDLMGEEQIIEEFEKEMGETILRREEGSGVGKYKYSLAKAFANYAMDIKEEYFEIRPMLIKAAQKDKITSRKGDFSLNAINLDKERLDNQIKRMIVLTAEFPKDNKGIIFSEDLDDYISGAEKGIDFTGKVEKNIHIGDFEYKTTKGKQELKWNGKLPAGTVLKLWVCDENGTRVSNIETITVIQQPVSLEWGSTADGNPATAYLSKNDKLTLSGSKDECVEVNYNGTTYYSSLDQTITPFVDNSFSKHNQQTATAGFVDVLNLKFEEKKKKESYTFIYDNEAFQVPSSSIWFENRGKTVSIILSENGTIKEVTIPGGKVTVSETSGTTFDFPVSWSGKDLIPAGSAISVSYVDQGGNEGKGSSVASRSTVTTPITLKIRPELNGNGYLNGRSNTLIVSGSACACEPIRVTAADMSQSTYAGQKEVWSESNGTWETMFDMTRLPEGGDFQITAEYIDVNGPSAAMTARFDAYVASPATFSPIYEEMTHLSGMAEPGTAVVLIVGDQHYEMKVDRFGRFSMDDVPMLVAYDENINEEEIQNLPTSFDIYVTDIAGNTYIRHYEIPKPGDPFEVSSVVNPLGKIFYSADKDQSDACVATPVRAEDLEDGTLELPLLFGMSYEVGKLTLTKTENGFTVDSEVVPNEEIDEDDYEITEEKLYVYTSKPTMQELRSHAGREYGYGEEIPLNDDETVWIVDEKEMTILEEDIMELELYDYDHSEDYPSYQEQ